MTCVHNVLPKDIVYQWIDKSNITVCKDWYEIWCNKPMTVRVCQVKSRTIFDPDMLFNFANLVKLSLGRSSNFGDHIKYLASLKMLVLDNASHITDATLTNLTNLASLTLKKNTGITGTSFKYLTNLTTLKYYSVNGTLGSELQHLTNLTKLRVCDAEDVFDHSLLSLTKINNLALWHCEYISDESVQHLTNVTSLSIMNTLCVTDVSIEKLTRLKRLDIDCNRNITLKFLTNLTTLNADDWRITSCALTTLTNLIDLKLGWDVPFLSPHCLTCMTWLKKLSLYSWILPRKCYNQLTSLESLMLHDCDIYD